jgi:hypothetical protein
MEVTARKSSEEQVKPRVGFVKGTSGNPAGRPALRLRAKELFAEMVGDFDGLSAVDRVLLQQAALLLARSEARVNSRRDADSSIRMSSEARRILSSLRKRADAPRDEPVVSQVLAARYGAAQAKDAPEGVEAFRTPPTQRNAPRATRTAIRSLTATKGLRHDRGHGYRVVFADDLPAASRHCRR